MEDQVMISSGSNFEVVKLMPYEFARDRVVEREIDEQRRQSEEGGRVKGQDKQGSGKRDSYVPFREW